MSAAVQFPSFARFAPARAVSRPFPPSGEMGGRSTAEPCPETSTNAQAPALAFYRKHTVRILRRYLLASMLVGRRPTILTEPLLRGWASHRVAETFEDCVIFVLDMEKVLNRLSALERVLISRVILQEYTEAETALLLNRGERFVRNRLGESLDHLTSVLLDCDILRLPHRPCASPGPESID